METDHFSSTLDLLKGFQVNLYVGEEIIKGILMGVESDHLIIEDENQYIYYYNIDKIQAITKNTKQFKSEEIKSDYLQTQSLVALLQSLKNCWVTILCLNKQSFNGVLSIVDKDFVTLINGELRVLVKISHIANILKGYVKEVKTEVNHADHISEVDQEMLHIEEKKAVTLTKSAQHERIDKREKISKSSKVILNESEKNNTVWSESKKSVNNGPNLSKTNIEMKKLKSEAKLNHHNDGTKPKAEIKQKKSTETQIAKTDIIPIFTKRENENMKKPLAAIGDKWPSKMDDQKAVNQSNHRNEISQIQELARKVKTIKDTNETKPLIKIENKKKSSVENRINESKPLPQLQPQEVGASRFAGVPASNDFDRRSFFSGWPNRNISPRRF